MPLNDICRELCIHKQEDCKFFAPVAPVGFEERFLTEPGSRFVHNTPDNYMLFVLAGKMTMTFIQYQNKSFEEGDMFFLPRNIEFHITVINPVYLVLLKYNNVKYPCMEEAIRELTKKKAAGTFSWDKIQIKEELRRCIEELIHYRRNGLSCNHIYVVKSQEIFLIFKHFYTDEERIQVYYPFIGTQPVFAEAVMNNYMKAKTAEELAARLGYGIKTFRRLFKENFGITPYKWMQEQTAIQIKGKLIKKEIPLKQIMLEYKFTTTSHFIIFCKKHFGGTPIEIRNGKVGDESHIII